MAITVVQDSITWFNASIVVYIVCNLGSVVIKMCTSVVDPCPINAGRDVEIFAEVAKKSGMQIIVSTVWYYNEMLSLQGWDSKTLASFMIKEIQDGIQGTNIKPPRKFFER